MATAPAFDAELLVELVAALGCSQCGHQFSDRACGPTHALIADDPTQHRLIQPLVSVAEARGRADVVASVEAVLISWDALTKGESPTTARIRKALAT